MRRVLAGYIVVIGLMMSYVPVSAQTVQASSTHVDPGTLSFALTYNADGGDLASANSIWLQGGSAELTGTAYRGLGVTASVLGLHSAAQGSTVAPVNLVIETFGPSYSWTSHKRFMRYLPTIFGQVLAGEGNGFEGVYPSRAGFNTSVNALALQCGGGVDLRLDDHVSLRVLQADWLRTQFPNSAQNVQNNFRLAAGIVFHTR